MKACELIEKLGIPAAHQVLLRMALGMRGCAALLDAEVELTIGREEGRVIVSLDGREAVSMTFEELEGYVNGPIDNESSLAGDGSRLACPPGVAGTCPD